MPGFARPKITKEEIHQFAREASTLLSLMGGQIARTAPAEFTNPAPNPEPNPMPS